MKGIAMELPALRLLIQNKLADGKLPDHAIPRVWGGPGNGETCDVCEGIISKQQILMEGAAGDRAIRFHVECFYLWVAVRSTPGR